MNRGGSIYYQQLISWFYTSQLNPQQKKIQTNKKCNTEYTHQIHTFSFTACGSDSLDNTDSSEALPRKDYTQSVSLCVHVRMGLGLCIYTVQIVRLSGCVYTPIRMGVRHCKCVCLTQCLYIHIYRHTHTHSVCVYALAWMCVCKS